MSKAGRMAASNVLLLKRSGDKRQEQALQEAFKRADLDGSGKLSVEECIKILQKYNVETTQEEINNLIEIAEKSGDRCLTMADLMGEPPQSQSQIKADMLDKAEKAFSIIDRNHDGYITKSELLQSTKKLSEAQINAVFTRNDKDGDGKLSKEEFTQMMCKEKR